MIENSEYKYVTMSSLQEIREQAVCFLRRLGQTVMIVLLLLTASCAAHKTGNTYDRNILRIRENTVDLNLYAPYAKNTRAVVPDTLSTLKIETDLPVLDGATALYPLYSAFAQAVYPKKKYSLYGSEVVCSNTIRSYMRLINKSADVIFVASPSTEQLEAAKKAGVTFRYTPVGKEAFVFFVNADNPVDNLTVEQLQAIYSGEITNWKDVGGNDESIRPFQRNENSGSQTAFIRFMQGKTIMKPPGEDVVGMMSGIVSQTADYANYGNAVGYSFRFYVREMLKNESVKILKINGVYPDPETVKEEKYPLVSQFFAVTLLENNKPNVLQFLDWIISKQGQYIVEKTGYCPIQ
ncbi:MAG: substrate-binding domain-containing protein [Prevotellaceae bacterium]|jgi:phosphate transport system substrate-binding protein|nr:substrate-binding domain-containing protein [Prevotellaceae bacterium]